MGLMTEIFVASRAQAVSYGHESSKASERAQLGGLTSLEFESLWAILAAEEWDVEKHKLIDVRSSESDWTFEFPAPFRALIQQLSLDAVPHLTMKWAATEELQGTEPIDLAPVMAHLVILERSASKQGKGLFLWIAL